MNNDHKLLSIILCGRNDNYCGDFKYRIQSCINYAGLNCARAGLKNEVEIVVVDWNSNEPLSQELKLLPDAYDICRYIEVSPSVASIYHIGIDQKFNGEAALNVGFRRTTAQYALDMPADVLLTETTLRNLVDVLMGHVKTVFDPIKTAMYLDRKMIPWQIVEKKFTVQEWDRYLQLCGRNLFHDRYYVGLNGGYGGLLLHRDRWAECQGFVEDNEGYGVSDTEWGLRINQKYPGISLAPLGIIVYDMAQRPNFMAQRKVGKSVVYRNRLDLNNLNWGLNNYDLKQTKGIRSEQIAVDPEIFIRPDQSQAVAKIKEATTTLVPKLSGSAQISHESAEYILLASLAWYCTTYLPIRYLEFNCHAGLSTLAFAALCPYGEIYSIDDYDEFNQSYEFQQYIDSLPHGRLYTMGFQGHAQIITGDGITAWERLQAGFIGEFRIDVAVVRCDMLKTSEICKKSIDEILAALPVGGALLVTAKSIELFNEVLIHIGTCHSLHFFMQSTTVPFIFLMKNQIPAQKIEPKDIAKSLQPQEAHRLGVNMLARGDAVAALPLLRYAAISTILNSDFYHNYGIALLRTGHEEDAIACFHHAVTLDPNSKLRSHPPLWRDRGDGTLILDLGFVIDQAYAESATIRFPSH